MSNVCDFMGVSMCNSVTKYSLLKSNHRYKYNQFRNSLKVHDANVNGGLRPQYTRNFYF